PHRPRRTRAARHRGIRRPPRPDPPGPASRPGQPGMNAAPSGRTVLWDLDGTLVGVRGRAVKTLMPVLAARSFRSTGPHRFLRELPGVLRAVRANDTELTNTDYMVGLLAERFALTPAEAEQ